MFGLVVVVQGGGNIPIGHGGMANFDTTLRKAGATVQDPSGVPVRQNRGWFLTES